MTMRSLSASALRPLSPTGLIPVPQVVRKTEPLPWRWRRRRRYRAELARLLKVGPHMIDDIGLGLEEARREAAKPFWRA